jgi:tetratricopeptide (TPR) repeat protein
LAEVYLSADQDGFMVMSAFPSFGRVWAVGFLALVLAAPAWALAEDRPGQADLDAATEAKLTAESVEDLQQVIDLCESAIAKGLADDGRRFAQDLLTSTLLERATGYASAILDRKAPPTLWARLRVLAMRDLEKLLGVDETSPDGHLLLARLLALPGGDRDGALAAANAALANSMQDELKSKAHVVLAQLAESEIGQLAELTKALALDKANLDALRLRATIYLTSDKVEDGLADLREIIRQRPEDVVAHQAAVEALIVLKKGDEAV